MGILDTISQLAGQAGDASQGDQAKVAGGFIQALTAHPEGIEGVLASLKSNGMADHIGSWMNGQAATATPEQVEQGLGSTGLIEKTAEHAGVSPAVVSSALAIILPMVVQHFAANGNTATATATTEQGGMGGLAQQILGKFIS
ncbi:MAG: YidB family protein [Edaphobacter sp.]|uniref:YidB family protein n=1 Tax=Edaphobacter sp. TaxID=1934404 RepID=UPI0023969A00|nr:YidB family protein [Edaphobacter sp.]MDE1178044.1 YidB family protein [Edaphobacter sp.]